MNTQLQNLLKELSTQYGNIYPILQNLAYEIENIIDSNIAAGGRWDGQGTDLFSGGNFRWTPLSKSTIKAYMKMGRTGEPTLYRSGRLRQSTAATVLGNSKIVLSSNSDYSAIHQFGGTIDFPERESSAKWKASKNQNGNYQYRFAKSKAKGKSILERKFKLKARSVTIPARPFLTLSPEDIEHLIDYIHRMLSQT